MGDHIVEEEAAADAATAQRDVARYDIYMSTRGFGNVTGMTRYTWVPGETFSTRRRS